MSLAYLLGEETLNEHQIAWRGQDWASVKALADTFKTDSANEFFFVLNQINKTKSRVNVDHLDSYNMYNIDSALSRHIDCIFHAYELNLLGDNISDQMHFDYYLHAVRTGNRFAGAGDIKDPIEEMVSKVFIKCVAKLFEVNTNRAEEYITNHFDDEKIKILKRRLRPLVTEDFVKQSCTYAKKADITKVLKEVDTWNK